MPDVLQTGLPADIDAEKLILGSILLDDSIFLEISGALEVADFCLEKHKLIFRRMIEIQERGEKVDRITLADQLRRYDELESVDGVSYLVSLDDGLPRLPSIDAYVRIVRDKSTTRKLFYACQNIQSRCLSGDPPRELVERGERLLHELGQASGSLSAWSNTGDVIRGYPGGLDSLITPPPGSSGLAVPWGALQQQICGLQPGHLVVLGARPSHGKTAAALQIAKHVAISGVEVAYFSLEMLKPALMRRLICGEARVNSHHARLGYLTKIQRASIQKAAILIGSLPLSIDDTGAYSAVAIRHGLKRLMATRPVGLAIIDHFHLVVGNGREDERQRYNRIADELQRLARELNIPFLVLAQLSRRCEELRRAPCLSDLKETAKLEENGDLVIFVYRPECYAANRDMPELKGIAEFIIAKQRDGPAGKIPMIFQKDFQIFEESAGTSE